MVWRRTIPPAGKQCKRHQTDGYQNHEKNFPKKCSEPQNSFCHHSDPSTIQTPIIMLTVNVNDRLQLSLPSPVIHDDPTLFTSHRSSLVTENDVRNSSAKDAVGSGTAAALGAGLSEVVMNKAICKLRKAYKRAAPSVAPFLYGEFGGVFMTSSTHPSYSGLTMIPSHQSPSFQRSVKKNHSKASISPASIGRAMAPFFVMFGTKTLVESNLGVRSQAEPISLASLSASVLGGTCLGMLQIHYFKQKMWASNLATEAGAAVLYFSSYHLLRNALLAQGEGQRSKHRHSRQSFVQSLTASATAGATAGSFYEIVRVYGTSSPLLLANTKHVIPSSPFSSSRTMHARVAPIVARAAPAHMLMFLGYETVQGLF